MRARLLAAGLALCALIAPIGAMGCHKQSDSSAPDLSVGSGVSSGLDLAQSLLGGSVKTEASPPGEDIDLKSALLVKEDLPPGYDSFGDMRTVDDSGSKRSVTRQFTQSDPGDPARRSIVVAGVLSGSGTVKFSSSDMKKQMDETGFFESTAALDVSGLGERGFGLRGMDRFGVMDLIMWSRDSLSYTLTVLHPDDWPNPPDGLALARIVDGRASGKTAVPSPMPSTTGPMAIPGLGDSSSLFGGATPKVDSDAPPPDLTALLLTKDDLPDGFVAIDTNMHLTYDTPTGPVDAAAGSFMRLDDKNQARGTMILSYAMSGRPQSSSAGESCEDRQSVMRRAGTYQSVESLDASTLGSDGCGTRLSSDAFTMDTYAWSRSGRELTLIVFQLDESSGLIEGLALAKVMDNRAQATH